MPQFNGETLTITLDAGVTEVDVQNDLYSAWKDWLLSGTTGENRKYPQAFRVVGGDDLTPGIKAGAYFFIRNDYGWRIKPAEEDATVLVTGNIAPQDSTLDILIPTDGDFSVLVAGLQPITQSVEDILVQGQINEYGGSVFVDFSNGSAGTEYPIGLQGTPVNNVIDAFTIAGSVGGKTIQIIEGTFILDRNALSYIFTNAGNGAIDVTGFNVGGSQFNGLSLSNVDFSATTSTIRFLGCSLNNISNFRGFADQCRMSGNISLQPVLSSFSYCSSLDDTSPAIFDALSGASQLNLVSWSGDFQLKNATHSSFRGSLDCISSKITLQNTCTNGQFSIRGVGSLDDQSSGMTLVREGFIEGEDVLQLREYIYIDTINGVTGTSENVGTIKNPVNNITDGRILAERRNTRAFKIKTDALLVAPITLENDYSGYIFEGAISPSTSLIELNGQLVNGTQFKGVAMTGSCVGNIYVENGVLSNVSGFVGVLNDCSISGVITPANYGETVMEDTFSLVTDLSPDLPIINMSAITSKNVQLRNHGGDITVSNLTSAGATFTLGIDKGTVTISNSNTNGTIKLRGIGVLNDNSAGSTINDDNLIDPRHIEELHRLQGLDPNNPMTVTKTKRIAGDIDLDITGDGINTATVTRN